MDIIRQFAIDELMASPVGMKLKKAMQVLESAEKNLFALMNSEDDKKLTLLKIGTVFQIFLIDLLASGKKPEEITEEDWIQIAEKVSQYAILEDGQRYCVFVFSLYADYIRISADVLGEKVAEDRLREIRNISDELGCREASLNAGEITESAYVEDCLWLSLEAMVKLLSSWLACQVQPVAGEEFAQLTEAVAQMAFEYGRYVLYAREQAILEAYIQNQYVLDAQLLQQYDAFLADLRENALRFRELIDAAFTPELHNALTQSAELARAAGVKEDEILSTTEDIDAFFMD